VIETQDIISALVSPEDEGGEETEEEPTEEVIEEEAEGVSGSLKKQGSRAKQFAPQPQVAGAATSSEILRLEQMIYLLQEIIRLTLLLKQNA
jgi:hypothetical protein